MTIDGMNHFIVQTNDLAIKRIILSMCLVLPKTIDRYYISWCMALLQ
jgi:hypothetical protein